MSHVLTCGIDIGSRSIECAIFDGTSIIGEGVCETGSSPTQNAEAIFHQAIGHAGCSVANIAHTTATGYGRNYYAKADSISSEIICHAIGVLHNHPEARTVIDIGGQDSKIMEIDERGKVVNFAMNDRCAAGTGKFIEMVARTTGIELEACGEMGATASSYCEISSMCAVFAESEIIGLLHNGTGIDTILKGVFRSVARRITGMAGKVSIRPEIIFTGGVALNRGIAQALQDELGHPITIPSQPPFTGAIGAAITAWEKATL